MHEKLGAVGDGGGSSKYSVHGYSSPIRCEAGTQWHTQPGRSYFQRPPSPMLFSLTVGERKRGRQGDRETGRHGERGGGGNKQYSTVVVVILVR